MMIAKFVNRRSLWSLLLLVLWLFGCAQQLPRSLDPAPLEEVGQVEEGGLFAADPSGAQLAMERDGLLLAEHPAEAVRLLAESPEVLTWSRDGKFLAAGFAADANRCEVNVFSPEGEVLREVVLPVNLLALEWSSRGELFAVGYQLKVYSFGGNLTLKLYRLDGSDAAPVDLGDVTIKPSTVRRFVDRLPSLLQVAFSPMGDELVYTRLHDPPEFPPYLQLVYRNWQEFEEHELVRLPVKKVQLDWDNQGESVVVNGLEGSEQFIRLWPIRPDDAVQHGAAGILSATGRYRFDDGRLFERDRLLIDWGRGARLQFLAEGQYLLEVDQGLYRGGGLSVEQPKEHDEKRWSLRRWRYHGLITPQEYQRLIQGE
jgi:hypothetical protein